MAKALASFWARLRAWWALVRAPKIPIVDVQVLDAPKVRAVQARERARARKIRHWCARNMGRGFTMDEARRVERGGRVAAGFFFLRDQLREPSRTAREWRLYRDPAPWAHG